MGRGRQGDGVEARDASIRISFTWRGQRYRETLLVTPTPGNIERARRLAREIRRRITLGTFDYSAFFPDSPRAGPADTFATYADRWCKSKGTLAAATRDKYRLAAEFWKQCELEDGTKLGSRIVTTLRQTEVEAVANTVPHSKHRNNILTALRGTCRLIRKDHPTLPDFTEDVKNGKLAPPLPDPLGQDEVEAVLADLAEHYDEQVLNYFEFMFFTGLRPEEAIALRWDDLDERASTIRVQRARTFKGTEKDTKTVGSTRDVDLNSRAKAVLARQKKHTRMKPDGHIFHNPVTGRPWHDERSQRDHYWQPALRRCKVRMRRAYNTRHTYATMLLMAGVNPAYVARQLGHANAQMVFRVYAKWIDGADRGRELAKLEANLVALAATEPKEGKSR